MLINKIRNLVKYWINDVQNGQMPNPDEFNSMVCIAQENVLNNHVKKTGVETYSWDADESASIKKTDPISKSNGEFERPSDLKYLLGLTYNYSYNNGGQTIVEPKDVDMLREKDFNKRSGSELVGPTAKYPIGKWTNLGYMVKPDAIAQLSITYIKQPEDPVWGYSQDANGRPVFNAGNSVDISLPQSMVGEIALDVLLQMGISADRESIKKIAMQKNMIDE